MGRPVPIFGPSHHMHIVLHWWNVLRAVGHLVQEIPGFSIELPEVPLPQAAAPLGQSGTLLMSQRAETRAGLHSKGSAE